MGISTFRVTAPIPGRVYGPWTIVRNVCARAHRFVNIGIAAGVPLQFYLAGAVLFGVASFTPHRVVGQALLLLGLLSAILASIAGRDRAQRGLAWIVFALLFLQPILATGLKTAAPAVAALHAVNGLGILGVSLLIVWRARAARR
jgi:hypothetical protein